MGRGRLLQRNATILDFEDVDGDGYSEAVAMVEAYDEDGYLLLFDKLRRKAIYCWSYH